MTAFRLTLAWAVLGSLLAWAAWGQTTFPREEADFIGTITIYNEATAATERVTTYTLSGVEVEVYYRSTPNFSGGDPRDIIRVTTPDGYIAIPADYLLPEGAAVEIRIYEALLG